jgi:beta-fructofuranosidase
MNDPNGLIHWNGQYHMFYQHNPNGPFWGSMHWGHAVSDDLVHWRHLPIALAPTPGTVDEAGCFSGCAVVQNGMPTIIYSGHRQGCERPCLATSSDPELVTWQKYQGNPVIAEPPPALDLVGFRDHCVWWEDDGWYQLIGAGIRDVGGAALLYRSSDLRHWEYLHPLCVGDLHQTEPVWSGAMWECPQFLRFANGYALLVSVWENGATRYSLIFTGDYAAHRFSPRRVQKLDYGDNYFYAPQACVDSAGRVLLWGWLQEGRSGAAQQAAGWSGVMSLPRLLRLHADGTPCMVPAPELAALRGQHVELSDLALQPGTAFQMLPQTGDCLELLLEVELNDATTIDVVLRATPDGSEQTRISYNRAQGWLSLNSQRASLDASTTCDQRGGPLLLAEGELLRLHIFLDRSVIEVFANERACLSGRIYPTRPDSTGLALVVHGGSARVASLSMWPLRSIWGEERLTEDQRPETGA